MKLNAITYLIAGSALLLATSCKKNNIWVDQDPVQTPPEAARFIMMPQPTATTYNQFFITSTPTPGSTFNLPVGLTTKSTTDRKVKFTYTSRTAVQGAQYNGPAELVIPAGSVVDTLRFQGIFAGFPTGRKDTVKVKITNSDGFVTPQFFQDSVLLVLQKYCDVLINDFDDDFDNTIEYSASGGIAWGPYTTSLYDIVHTPNTTSATCKIDNLYDYGGTVTAKLDWTDKAKFTVTIAEQYTGVNLLSGGSVYELWIRTNGTASTFSSCENNITLYIDAIAKVPATGATAGLFSSNYKIVMNK